MKSARVSSLWKHTYIVCSSWDESTCVPGSRNQNKSCEHPDTVELGPLLPIVVVEAGITLPLSFFLWHEKLCSYKNRYVYIAKNEAFSLCFWRWGPWEQYESPLVSLICTCLKPSGFQTGLFLSAVFPPVYVTQTFHVAMLVDDQGIRRQAVSVLTVCLAHHHILFSLGNRRLFLS